MTGVNQPANSTPDARPTAAVDHTRRRGVLFRLATISITTTLALAVAEVAVRMFVPPPRVLAFAQLDAALQGRADSQFMPLIESDPQLFWRLAPNVRLPSDTRPFFGLVSNAAGLREDHEIQVPKPAGEIRILFLGDSCTYGYMLDHSETVVQQTESLLRRNFPDRRIECINAGVPGYSAFQGLQFLRHRGAGLAPDLVVANFGWNDAGAWDELGDLEQYRRWQAIQPPAFFSWSRLAQIAWQAIRRVEHPPGKSKGLVQPGSGEMPVPSRSRLEPEEFASVLAEIRDVAGALGSDFVLLIGAAPGNVRPETTVRYATEYQKKQLELGNTLRLAGGALGYVDGIEIANRLASTHSMSELFLDDVHGTALMNAALAEDLAAKLKLWILAQFQ